MVAGLMVERKNALAVNALPEGVSVAPDVDLDAADPSFDGNRRRCIALTAAGNRCRVNAVTGHSLCTAHAGYLDSSAGGHAKARKLALVREEARTREIEARLGARAVVAARAIERASDLRRAFDVVLDDALAGNRASARTLLSYLTAAFPDAGLEGQGHTPDAGDLTSLSTSQLRALAFAQEQQ